MNLARRVVRKSYQPNRHMEALTKLVLKITEYYTAAFQSPKFVRLKARW